MKQHITVEQLEELSEKGRERLTAFFNKNPITGEIPKSDFQWGIYPSQLTIGQMIEFLVDHATEYSYPVALLEHDDGKMKPFYQPEWINGVLLDDSFVENLWEATKEVLEREE